MAKSNGKKTTTGTRNSDRPNGKAWKKNAAGVAKAGASTPERKNG